MSSNIYSVQVVKWVGRIDLTNQWLIRTIRSWIVLSVLEGGLWRASKAALK